MALVFVSYRTADAAHVAAAVHERLVAVFGPEQVFRDARSMGPGERYPLIIRSALRRADVVVAVIGPRWLATDERGQRLVDRDSDWVRWEISTAVEFGIPIVPVLVDETPLPDAAALPGRMAELTRFQVARVRHTDQGSDLDRLTAALAQRIPALAVNPAPPIPPDDPGSSVSSGLSVHRRAFVVSIVLVVVLASTAVAAFTVGRNSVRETLSTTSTQSPGARTSTALPGGTAVQPSFRLRYPDPTTVTDAPWRIRVQVQGQSPDNYLIWTGARAADEDGNPLGSHGSLLWTNQVGDDVWETSSCFGLGREAGALVLVYAYLVPKEVHPRWLDDKKNGPGRGFLQKTDFELERDRVGVIGPATVRLATDQGCLPAP